MKPTTPLTIATIGLLAITSIVFVATRATATSTAPAAAAGRDDAIERGRYLVENVGMCADCHSPRLPTGQFDRSRWLLGATLPFQPSVPMPWVPAAPPIAGLPSMTEPQAIAFLQTGQRPDGTMPRPPMPEFRFSAHDAVAVTAYLKSLAR